MFKLYYSFQKCWFRLLQPLHAPVTSPLHMDSWWWLMPVFNWLLGLKFLQYWTCLWCEEVFPTSHAQTSGRFTTSARCWERWMFQPLGKDSTVILQFIFKLLFDAFCIMLWPNAWFCHAWSLFFIPHCFNVSSWLRLTAKSLAARQPPLRFNMSTFTQISCNSASFWEYRKPRRNIWMFSWMHRGQQWRNLVD